MQKICRAAARLAAVSLLVGPAAWAQPKAEKITAANAAALFRLKEAR